ncbi:MAG: DUF188 domain-containing protein [Treponema sp.]|jgi:uncharacterized protein YaiI (UPF0178 family)|nr:DUF188 domain-containing protein [Treponema sp.]
MKMFVDADSCPKEARELVLQSARRRGIEAVFAANRSLPGISGSGITMELCPPGDNSADNRIIELSVPGDLAISRDVPLAKQLVEKGVAVLDDRGRVFTKENIGELLSLRNFMVGLAENGLETERSAHYGKKELKTFADSLDRLLTKMLKNAN